MVVTFLLHLLRVLADPLLLMLGVALLRLHYVTHRLHLALLVHHGLILQVVHRVALLHLLRGALLLLAHIVRHLGALLVGHLPALLVRDLPAVVHQDGLAVLLASGLPYGLGEEVGAVRRLAGLRILCSALQLIPWGTSPCGGNSQDTLTLPGSPGRRICEFPYF